MVFSRKVRLLQSDRVEGLTGTLDRTHLKYIKAYSPVLPREEGSSFKNWEGGIHRISHDSMLMPRAGLPFVLPASTSCFPFVRQSVPV